MLATFCKIAKLIFVIRLVSLNQVELSPTVIAVQSCLTHSIVSQDRWMMVMVRVPVE